MSNQTPQKETSVSKTRSGTVYKQTIFERLIKSAKKLAPTTNSASTPDLTSTQQNDSGFETTFVQSASSSSKDPFASLINPDFFPFVPVEKLSDSTDNQPIDPPQTTSTEESTTTTNTTSTATTAAVASTNITASSGNPPTPPTPSVSHDDQSTPSTMAVNLNKVAVIPWIPGEPEAWFRLLEAAFTRERVTTEADKCFLVNKYAKSEDIAKITVIACKASYDNGDYDKLKSTLIAMNTLSDDQKFAQLLSDEELGDRKPSELYHKLFNMASSISTGAVPKNLVFNRWVSKLPTDTIGFVKTLSDSFDPDKHLKAVDDLVTALADRRSSRAHVSSVQQHPRSNSRARFRSNSQQRSNSVDRSQPRQRSNSVDRSQPPQNGGPRFRSIPRDRRNNRSYNNNGDLCWYHHTFGAKARKCNKTACPMKGNDGQ